MGFDLCVQSGELSSLIGSNGNGDTCGRNEVYKESRVRVQVQRSE